MTKIQELEKRIRELEARPVYVPIYIGSPLQQPCPQPLPWYPNPQLPYIPWWHNQWSANGNAVGISTTIPHTAACNTLQGIQ